MFPACQYHDYSILYNRATVLDQRLFNRWKASKIKILFCEHLFLVSITLCCVRRYGTTCIQQHKGGACKLNKHSCHDRGVGRCLKLWGLQPPSPPASLVVPTPVHDHDHDCKKHTRTSDHCTNVLVSLHAVVIGLSVHGYIIIVYM